MLEFTTKEQFMNAFSRKSIVRLAVSATVMVWMAASGFAAVQPKHGPTFPPDPWCGLVAQGKVAHGKVAHGPTFPPDPWCGKV